MHRIDHPTRDVDLFGSGKHGFTEGSPGTEAATVVTDDWLNGVQEEICNAIEGHGITLVKGTRDQLLTALQALCPPTSVLSASEAKSEINNGSSLPEWLFFKTGGNKNTWISQGDTKALVFPLSRLPVGLTIDLDVTVRVKPGAARTGTNRMTVRIDYAEYDDVDTTAVNSSVYDDGTTNAQDVVSSTTSLAVASNRAYVLVIFSGNTGASAQDEVYGVEIAWTPS